MRHEVYLYSLGHFCKCLTRLEIQSKRQANECFYAVRWNPRLPAAMLLPMTVRWMLFKACGKDRLVSLCNTAKLWGESKELPAGAGCGLSLWCDPHTTQRPINFGWMGGDRAGLHLGVRTRDTQKQRSLRSIILLYLRIW